MSDSGDHSSRTDKDRALLASRGGGTQLLRVAARRLVRQIAYAAIGAVGLASRLRWRAPRQSAAPPARILVIRLDLLGDVLFSMPLVVGLRKRYADARIVMLTLPYAAPLARLYPEVDDVIEVDTNRIRSVRSLFSPDTWKSYITALRRLRSEKFDVAVSVNGRMASLWAWLSDAPRVTGFEGDAYPFMLGDAVTGGRYLERRHEVEYVRELAEHLGAQAPRNLAIPVSEAAREEIDRRLRAEGVTPHDTVVAIHGGSVNGNAKRWPAPYWSRFIDALAAETPIRVVLVGAGADLAIASEIVRGAASPVISMVGETDVPQLIALLARADLVATGDSGPLHLAVALGRPLLGVYGPTDPAIYGPYGATSPATVHRADLPCSPCYDLTASADCPLGDPICMRLVSVEQMLDSAKDLLATPSL